MATTKNNVIVKGASGKFGRQIVFSQRAGKTIMRPLQNLHPLNFHPYTLRRMNIFDRKMPLEVIFE